MLAVSVVHNEADIVGFTLDHLHSQGARIAVADNLSTDATPSILAEWALAYPDEVIVEMDDDPAHQQGEKITNLISRYALDGEWVVPFDADELWSGLDSLASASLDVVAAALLTHVPHPGDDPVDDNPFTRIGHRSHNPERLAKWAFRYRAGVQVADGNHAVVGAGHNVGSAALDVRHMQYRTLDQVRHKVRHGAAALALTDRPPACGAHWREMAAWSDPELEAWWASYCGQDTLYDPAPWRRSPPS